MSAHNLLEGLANGATIISLFLSVSASRACYLSVAGRIPRAGPGRAVYLAFRSRFFPVGDSMTSVRSAEVKKLQHELHTLKPHQYIVVFGQKGVGKSCCIDTAVRKNCGVLQVLIPSGTTSTDITWTVLREVLNWQLSTTPVASANRVLFFYRLFFRSSPTVIIRAAERIDNTSPAAEISAAARDLATVFKLKVIIDASDNAYPAVMRSTLRETMVEVEQMPREMIMGIPELQSLFEVLKAADLENVTWAVLGGVPASYFQLSEENARNDANYVTVFLQTRLTKAIGNCDKLLIQYPGLTPILDMFSVPTADPKKYLDSVPISVLKTQNVILPTPCKVLREVIRNGKAFLVPADAATALILRHKFNADTSIADIRKVCE